MNQGLTKKASNSSLKDLASSKSQIDYRSLMSNISISDEILDPSIFDYLMELDPDIQNLIESAAASTEVSTTQNTTSSSSTSTSASLISNEEQHLNEDLDQLTSLSDISLFDIEKDFKPSYGNQYNQYKSDSDENLNSENNIESIFDFYTENDYADQKTVSNQSSPGGLRKTFSNFDNDGDLDEDDDSMKKKNRSIKRHTNSSSGVRTRQATAAAAAVVARNKRQKLELQLIDDENQSGGDNTNSSSIITTGTTTTIKKGSNKEAATRYRMKKLTEKDMLFDTKTHLEKQNDDVKKKIDHVQTEINYLKNLLVQMLLTKGVLNNIKGGFA